MEAAQLRAGGDFGKEVEVLAGLSADQSIILNPSDSLVSGQAVKPQTLPQTARNGK